MVTKVITEIFFLDLTLFKDAWVLSTFVQYSYKCYSISTANIKILANLQTVMSDASRITD